MGSSEAHHLQRTESWPQCQLRNKPIQKNAVNNVVQEHSRILSGKPLPPIKSSRTLVMRSFFSILSSLLLLLRPSSRRTDATTLVCGDASPPEFARPRHGFPGAHSPAHIPSSTVTSARRASEASASVQFGCNKAKVASESTHLASSRMDHVP